MVKNDFFCNNPDQIILPITSPSQYLIIQEWHYKFPEINKKRDDNGDMALQKQIR